MSNAITRVIEGFLEPVRLDGQEKKIVKQFVEQVATIQSVTDVSRIVVDEISNTHGYAGFKMATTREGTRRIVEAVSDGSPDPEGEEAYKRLDDMYVDTILDVVEYTDARIINEAFGNKKRR